MCKLLVPMSWYGQITITPPVQVHTFTWKIHLQSQQVVEKSGSLVVRTMEVLPHQ
jgi:hypothetical protein